MSGYKAYLKGLVLFPLICLFFLIDLSCGAETLNEGKSQYGAIYYFGYEGLDLEKIKAKIPFKLGTEYTREEMEQGKAETNKILKEMTGKEVSDFASVYFDQSMTLYIGLPGSSNHLLKCNPTPTGKDTLPDAMIINYVAEMDASHKQLEKGLKGNSAEEEKLRKSMVDYAKGNKEHLLKVLETSSESRQRYVAAHIIGLDISSSSEIDALAKASHDADSTVRNNAVRALVVLGYEKDNKLANAIPFSVFVEMLNSGIWTDRNKSSFAMDARSKTRDPKVLEALRKNALASLREIARWDIGHASPALSILGRIAGFSDEKLAAIFKEGKFDEIITAKIAAD